MGDEDQHDIEWYEERVAMLEGAIEGWRKENDRLRNREEKIVSFFEEMAEAIRGSRQFKPNPRTERFINRKLEELREILGQ